jgi:hypothetical protein
MLPQPQGFSVQPNTSALRSLLGFKPTASRLAHLRLMLLPDAISYPGPQLDELVRTLMACTPLGELSSMQARCVFELLLQRGWRIVKVKTDD